MRILLTSGMAMAHKKIFIAFTGPPINQAEPIHHIAEHFECWDLKHSEFDEFLESVKKSIPPIHNSVLGNYTRGPQAPNASFGIVDAEYKKASWGLMLPDIAPGVHGGGYAEALFLLNLYSPYFLFPVFFVTDMGIDRPHHRIEPLLYFAEQNQAGLFKERAFARFYDALYMQSVYGAWQTDRMAKWDQEDWRLFTACLLFNELKGYQGSKEVFTWQRESASIATALEVLFTAGDNDNTEVGYKLRKRAAALIGVHLLNIESDIKELYKQRSSFVHGSFFIKLHKQIKVEDGFAKMPSPPFEFLHQQKENLRRTLVAYLYISMIHRSNRHEFGDCKCVTDILERSIIDTGLRSIVRKHAQVILNLLPS